MAPRRQLSAEESAYWRAFNDAVKRHCREYVLEFICETARLALRRQWHSNAKLPESHSAFDHDDYSVAIAYFNAYARGGEFGAAALNLDAVREQSQRARYLWKIDHTRGRAYCEPMAREAMRLPQFEAVDWDAVPLDVLANIARAMETRRRRAAQQRVEGAPF